MCFWVMYWGRLGSWQEKKISNQTIYNFIGLIVDLFTGYRIKFEGKGMECGKVNEMMDKVAESVDCAKRKLCEDSSNAGGTNED
jgi:hypothetical protein